MTHFKSGEPEALDKVISLSRPAFGLIPEVEAEADADTFSSDSLSHVAMDDDGFTEELDVDEIEAPIKKRRRARGEKAVLVPLGEDASVFDVLAQNGLVQKLTRIVLAKAKVPPHLKKDAEQSIHLVWASIKANPKYECNQVAFYAYKAGESAALKLRREIGAVVAIPGALFRTGRDSHLARNIGAAVQPRDIDDYRDSLELAEYDSMDFAIAPAITVEFLQERLAGLTLTAKQRAAAENVLVHKMPLESVALLMGLEERTVERMLNQTITRIYERDHPESQSKTLASLNSEVPLRSKSSRATVH